MTPKQIKTFRDMYANGSTYTEIAIAIDSTVQDIRDIYKQEKQAGRMNKITAQRLKAKNTMPQEPVIEIIHEDGMDIPRHRAGFAMGVKPQVTAKAVL